MANYERHTPFSIGEVLDVARDQFTSRADLERTREKEHDVTYSGPEGTVTVQAHRHGPITVVTARTNRLRTSRLDNIVRHFLNRLPYQPGDSTRGAE